MGEPWSLSGSPSGLSRKCPSNGLHPKVNASGENSQINPTFCGQEAGDMVCSGLTPRPLHGIGCGSKSSSR